MSDSDMVLVGVGRCGCVTAVLVGRYGSPAEVREFYLTMADTQREVRRMPFAEAKASPHFLNCPHEEAPRAEASQADQDTRRASIDDKRSEALKESYDDGYKDGHRDALNAGERLDEVEEWIADVERGVLTVEELVEKVRS